VVTRERPGRGPLVAVVAVVAVVVVVAVVLGLHGWYEQQPPALDESGPGTVLRLTTESGGVPPPGVRVRTRDGSTTSVSMAGIDTSRGRPVGLVMVEPSGGQGRQLALAEGQDGEAGGLRVTMLHVWRMPDSANDAIDVRVLPGP
jgi:hypothetical protein